MGSLATRGRAGLPPRSASARSEQDGSLNADATAVTTEEPTDDAIVADVAGQTEAGDDGDAVVYLARALDVPASSQELDPVDLGCQWPPLKIKCFAWDV